MKKSFQSLGAVFFVEDRWLGGILVLSCFIHPAGGVAAFLAGLGAWAVSKHLRPVAMSRLPELLNAGLWGLFLGTFLPLELRTVLLAILGGALLAGCCLELTKLCEKRGLTAVMLSLPFALGVGLTAWMLPDVFPQFGRPEGDPLRQAVPVFFESLSVVTFSARWEWGLVFFLLVLRRSPWLAALAVSGFLLGWLGEGLILHHDFQLPPLFSCLNYILLAMALGGGLLPPDRYSFWRVSGGVGAAVILQLVAERFLGGSSWLAVTVSFNVIALLFFYGNGTGILHPDWLNMGLSPEERLNLRRYRRARYPLETCEVHLPVLGEWQVYQGEEGAWTHQYAWKHAVDFVLQDDQGARHIGTGKSVEDYYAWNKTVVSPISGVVETAVAGYPDQTIGLVETEHNWGNYIILRDARGFRVLIAHLKHQSLLVTVGQVVERGQWLARCGNSGYSPEPHVHLHVQQGAFPGDETLPFKIAGMAVNHHLPRPRMPETGEAVERRESDLFLNSATSYLLDQQLCFLNDASEESAYKIELAADGSFRFRKGKHALYFGRHKERFIFYSVEGDDPFLTALFRHFPSIPLYARQGDCWEDVLPLPSTSIGWRTGGLPEVSMERAGVNVVRSKQAQLELSDTHGIVKLETPEGNWSLKGAPRKVAQEEPCKRITQL